MNVPDDSTMPGPSSSFGRGNAGLGGGSPNSFGADGNWDLPLGPGERIGNYQIVQLIGKGGMGAVFEALQDRPRRTVAVKVMKLGLQSRTAFDRFVKEAEFLAKLSHPAIAQVYEAGAQNSQFGELLFYAMEFIAGGRTLTEYAAQEKLDIRAKLELFAKACLGVDHGHRTGIIHRDLKPANILVDALGNPKIIDFGVARFSSHADGTLNMLTRMGDLVGTLQYMSPEQCNANPGALDARSDVYALGLILYELLTGRLPYDLEGKDLPSAVSIIHNAKPPELGRIDSRLSGPINAVVMKALNKERDLRYASAAELAVDIQRLLEGKPPFALRADLGIKAWIWWRGVLTKRTASVLVGAAAVSLALVQWVVVPQLGRSTTLTPWLEKTYGTMPLPTSALTPLSHVAAVEIRETPEEQRSAAEQLGLVGWDPAAPFSRRALTGAVLKKLAPCGLGVLAFDIEYEDTNPEHPEFDAAFAEGVESLRQSGTVVLFGSGTWAFDVRLAKTPPKIRALIRDGELGGATATVGEVELGKVVAAVKRPTIASQPSLGLLAALHWKAPTCTFHFEVSEFMPTIEVGMQAPGTSSTKAVPLTITASSVTTQPEDDEIRGMPKGSIKSLVALRVPTDDQLQGVTLTATDVARFSTAQLREKLAGRAVVLGQHLVQGDGSRMDEQPMVGRMVWGTHMKMICIDQLITDNMPRFAPSYIAWGVAALSTAAGAVLAVLLRRWTAVLLATLGLTLCVVVISIIAYRTTGYFVNPTVPIAGLLIAAAIATPLMMQLRRVRPLEGL